MNKDRLKKKYSNGEVTVFWNPELCIHATTCYAELPEVFKPYKRPWVEMSGASTAKIIEVVKKCPTAALDYAMNSELKVDENMIDAKLPPVEIKVKSHGPLIIKGNFTLIDTSGETLPKKERVALCRCGASREKPFCDGEHSFIDFE